MKGAKVLLDTLSEAGVEVIFANPGTSEMHLVAALDEVSEVRAVLALFEGVATGAADGYARIAGKPAAVLLHLGPGLGNGLANLHNARRAGVPVVVVVGDHATFHEKYDAPLQSDIAGMARTVSGWVRRTGHTDELAADARAAFSAATGSPAQVATLIVPADVSWNDAADVAALAAVSAVPAGAPAAEDAVAQAASALQAGASVRLLLGGEAVREPALSAAARVAEATAAKLLCETFPTRWERGAGVPKVERLEYFGEQARPQLAGATHLILVGARSPVTFFAYPGPNRPSDLVPSGCSVLKLAVSDLPALADKVAPNTTAPVQILKRPDLPKGKLDISTIAAIVAALLPERAIIVDESTTAGGKALAATEGSPRHDWLTLTGGSIGYGLPAATGAAIAAPDRPVLCLQSDGSAMYTISALWTQAREKLNVTTVIYNNGSYDILRAELRNVGLPPKPGPKAETLLGIGNPAIDFAAIATGMGVPASRARTAEEFVEVLTAALEQPGPHLIDATIDSLKPFLEAPVG